MNWRTNYKGQAKELVKEVFNKYKTCRAISLKGVSQRLETDFENVRVQGGNANNVIEDRIIEKADADVFVEMVEEELMKRNLGRKPFFEVKNAMVRWGVTPKGGFTND